MRDIVRSRTNAPIDEIPKCRKRLIVRAKRERPIGRDERPARPQNAEVHNIVPERRCRAVDVPVPDKRCVRRHRIRNRRVSRDTLHSPPTHNVINGCLDRIHKVHNTTNLQQSCQSCQRTSLRLHLRLIHVRRHIVRLLRGKGCDDCGRGKPHHKRARQTAKCAESKGSSVCSRNGEHRHHSAVANI